MAILCTTDGLAESSKCFVGQDENALRAQIVVALCQIFNGGGECSSETLTDAAVCLGKLDRKTLLAYLVSILCQAGNSETSSPKVYRASLNQTGTGDPVATVLENTIGPVTWQRDAQGIYFALYDGGVWPSANIWLSIGGAPQAGDAYPFYVSGGNVVLNKYNVTVVLGTLTYVLIDELSSLNVEIIFYP